MIKKRIKSFRDAFRGIGEFIILEFNAKIQLFAAVVTILVGIFVGLTTIEWMIVTLSIGFVLSAESMNTALEELADEVSEDKRERIRRAKDIAAGSVLIASLTALVIAFLIIAHRI